MLEIDTHVVIVTIKQHKKTILKPMWIQNILEIDTHVVIVNIRQQQMVILKRM